MEIVFLWDRLSSYSKIFYINKVNLNCHPIKGILILTSIDTSFISFSGLTNIIGLNDTHVDLYTHGDLCRDRDYAKNIKIKNPSIYLEHHLIISFIPHRYGVCHRASRVEIVGIQKCSYFYYLIQLIKN